MRDPQGLLTWHAEPTPLAQGGARVMVHAFTGFLDAGNAAGLATEALLARDTRLLATFDVDELLDYRARRPRMTYVTDHFAAVDIPQIALHEAVDEAGTRFLVLAGPEPDYQWQRFLAAVVAIVDRTGVDLVVGLSGIPWPAPHTRPLGVTLHGTDPALLVGQVSMLGTLEVPGHIGGMMELRLGEEGHTAAGIAAHVPHYLVQFAYPRAAIALLERLASLTGLAVPVADLTSAAVQADVEVAEQLAGSEEFGAVVQALEAQYDQVASMRSAASAASDLAPDGDVPSGDEIAAQVEQFLAAMGEDDGDTPR